MSKIIRRREERYRAMTFREYYLGVFGCWILSKVAKLALDRGDLHEAAHILITSTTNCGETCRLRNTLPRDLLKGE